MKTERRQRDLVLPQPPPEQLQRRARRDRRGLRPDRLECLRLSRVGSKRWSDRMRRCFTVRCARPRQRGRPALQDGPEFAARVASSSSLSYSDSARQQLPAPVPELDLEVEVSAKPLDRVERHQREALVLARARTGRRSRRRARRSPPPPPGAERHAPDERDRRRARRPARARPDHLVVEVDLPARVLRPPSRRCSPPRALKSPGSPFSRSHEGDVAEELDPSPAPARWRDVGAAAVGALRDTSAIDSRSRLGRVALDRGTGGQRTAPRSRSRPAPVGLGARAGARR